MSKFFAALMAFIMMLLSWLGIGGRKFDDPVPETTTAAVSAEQTEEPVTGQESSIVRENAYSNNIAFGCTYVKDREAYPDYPDTNGAELTDGMYSYSRFPSYSNGSFSGYTRLWDTSMKIDVDLGQIHSRIYSFAVSYLATDGAGINIPDSVAVFLSDDGINWARQDNAAVPAMVKGTVQTAVLTLGSYVSARYVRFSIYASSAFVFLDEVFVTADEEQSPGGGTFSEAVENAYIKYAAPGAPETGADIDKTLGRVSVSAGKQYTFEGDCVSPFVDASGLLTDGSAGNTYESGNYAGLQSAEGQKITVDLGETVGDIAGVEVTAYSRVPTGIYLPCAVCFTAVGEDGTRTALGTRYAPLEGKTGSCTFALELNKAVSARKIEVEFPVTPCTRFYLVDEVEVYAYRTEIAVSEPCYPPVSISCEDNGEWDATEADYGEYKNLLLGRTPQIIASASMSEAQNARNTKADSGLITDGVHSLRANIYNGLYQIFYQCKSRQVIFDLEKACSLNRFTCEFTNLTGWAVYSPESVGVYLSRNGNDWYNAGSIVIDISSDNTVLTGVLELENAVMARYICCEFSVKQFAGCSEIEAFGTKKTAAAVPLCESGLEGINLFTNRRYIPNADFLEGAGDTCLLYHSRTSGYTAEQLLPYVAYVDGNGNISDTMFDSFLFLLSGSFPSGLAGYSDGRLTDWQWCIDDLFTENENIPALEQAGGTVKEALGLPADYAIPFTVSVYCPNVQRKDFGDIDGDGVNEDFSVPADRIKALKAYSDMFESRLAQYDFKNIRFAGYYWIKESMDTVNGDDVLVSAFADYIHERNLDLCWIPYYRANGFNSWRSYGFDGAVMQPNYVFSDDVPLTHITETALLTQLYGLGIEIEVDNSCLTSDEYYKRYMEYLSNGVKYGYMNDTISMYYQDLYIYYNASRSTGMARLLYDNTYKYIKGTLDIYPGALEDQTFVCGKNKILGCTLKLPDSLWHEVVITSLPASGSLTISPDGVFSYYPAKDFTGEVSFTFTYSTSFEQSSECRAVIQVE